MTKYSKKSSSINNARTNLLYRAINVVLSLPRLVRILVAAIFGIAVTAALFPLVDQIYITNFFSEQTIVVPSLVSAGAGILMYVTGWILVVGTRGSQPPKRLAILFYIFAGVIMVLYVLILLVNGYSSAMLPDG